MNRGIALRTGIRPGAAVARLARSLGSAGAEIVLGAATILEGAIVDELSTPGRGRIRRRESNQVGAGSYRVVKGADGVKRLQRVKRGAPRTNIGSASRASAPGDPPAPDKGRLRGSIHTETLDKSVRAGTNEPSAEPLNNGTTTAGRNHRVTIAPRPFMEPAFAKSETAMGEDVRVKLVKLGDTVAREASGGAS